MLKCSSEHDTKPEYVHTTKLVLKKVAGALHSTNKLFHPYIDITYPAVSNIIPTKIYNSLKPTSALAVT